MVMIAGCVKGELNRQNVQNRLVYKEVGEIKEKYHYSLMIKSTVNHYGMYRPLSDGKHRFV